LGKSAKTGTVVATNAPCRRPSRLSPHEVSPTIAVNQNIFRSLRGERKG
jgi:hypothetical protein